MLIDNPTEVRLMRPWLSPSVALVMTISYQKLQSMKQSLVDLIATLFR
jgi:hypothetical protein